MTDPASQQDSTEKKTPSAPSRYDRFVAVLDLVLFSAMIVMGLLGTLGVVNTVPPDVCTWALVFIGDGMCITVLRGRDVRNPRFWSLLVYGLGLAAWILRHRT